MTALPERLASVLADVLPVEQESDGGLTVRHDGTFASLRVVTIVEGLDVVSLTQILAWDLPATKKTSDLVAAHAREANFGAVITTKKAASKTADVMLRYNFPGAGLSDDALRTLILLVLDGGARIRRSLVP